MRYRTIVEHPHECANDCPFCCPSSPEVLDLGAPEQVWRAHWEAWAAEESDLPVGRRVWP